MHKTSKQKVQSLSPQSNKNITHPLFGANTSTLLSLFWHNRPLSSTYFPQLGLALMASIARWPITQIERLYTEFRVKPIQLTPPIFIVGHWRSGTTHLANIMSQSPQFGYVSPIASGLPWELLTIGRAFRPLLEKSIPKDRLIDRVPVTPHSPQEDEFGMANMYPISFLHGLYFPQNLEKYIQQGIFWDNMTEQQIRRWHSTFLTYLKKVFLYEGKKQLIIRNPVYTARMNTIVSLIPEAKFIHIYRNPYRVFVSMQNYYRKLLPALALEKDVDIDIDSLIFQTYSRMMEVYEQDAKHMEDHQLINIQYEDLDQNPLQVLHKVYEQLNISGFEADYKHFERYLASIHSYTKNSYALDEEIAKQVQLHWGTYIEKWGYV